MNTLLASAVDTAVEAGYGFDVATRMSPKQLFSISDLFNERIKRDLRLNGRAASLPHLSAKGQKKFIEDTE